MVKEFIKNVFSNGHDDALISDRYVYSYDDLRDAYDNIKSFIENETSIQSGSVVSVKGEFELYTIALMLVLFEKRCIYVPLAKNVKNIDRCLDIAQVEYMIDTCNDLGTERNTTDDISVSKTNNAVNHSLLIKLRSMNHPGIVFFSSGTTGDPKAAVHDVIPFLKKFAEGGAKTTLYGFSYVRS